MPRSTALLEGLLEKLISFHSNLVVTLRIMVCFMIIRELPDVDVPQIKFYYIIISDIVTCPPDTHDKGSTVCAAFLDLRKAFDPLDLGILLDRVYKLGVSGTELL